ncbi:sulfotransferase family protein [Salinibacter ruber]|uniref:sulfotransferase family protein n=1 Tax=Salinibacter ruber TaxID=146919 RepID=UPI002168DBB4|nr:sulfotransferase [Salinibacter ruber]
MGAKPSSARHIFILGAPRSGTTLVQLVVKSHSRLCTHGTESGIFTYRDLFDRNRNPFGLDREVLHRQREKCESIVEFFDACVQEVLDEKGTDCFVEKTPQHIKHLGFLTQHFPNSYFIHVYRDGRDCYCSARSGQPPLPRSESVEQFARYWQRCIQSRSAVADASQVLDVQYEKFTSRPEEGLRRIMDFIGLDVESQQLESEEREKDPRTGAPRHSKLTEEISTRSQGRWTSEMNKEEMETFEGIAGEELRYLGYKLRK